MGGSGIAGDVVAAAFNASCRCRSRVLKQFRTPAFVGPNTLAFAVSYSGDTEETLSMARSAAEQGAQLVAVSCGGELAALAREPAVCTSPCPTGFLPRAALGALVAPLCAVLFRMGLAPGRARDADAARRRSSRTRRDQCRPRSTVRRIPRASSRARSAARSR